MKEDWKIIICGIICLTILEAIALFNGTDGLLFTSIVGAICLMAGVALPQWPKVSRMQKTI